MSIRIFIDKKAVLCASLVISAMTFLGCCGTMPTVSPAPAAEVVKAEAAPQPPVNLDSTVVSRETLFGNPDKSSVQLSPDGSELSFLAPVNGVMNVWVGPVDDPNAALPVTSDTVRGIRTYFWAYTNQHVIYLQDTGGDENWHVFAADLGTKKTVDLTPIEKIHATIEGVSHKFKEDILVGINDKNPELHDIYKINITTGVRTLVQDNPGFAGFVVDDDYRVRFAVEMTEDGGAAYYQNAATAVTSKTSKKAKKADAKSKKAAPKADAQVTPSSDAGPKSRDGWELFMTVAMEDSLSTQPMDFNKTGDVLYLLDSRGRDTAAFAEWDLKTSEEKIVAEDPRADLDDLMIHPTEKTVEAAAFTYERKQWKILNSAIQGDFDYLRNLDNGDVEILDRTLADDKWMVAYLNDTGPVRYYLYNRAARQAKFLFTNRKALETIELAPMHPLVIPSRDGLSLVSYLTLPLGSDKDGDGKPDAPVPLVLNVHGGPWARDDWGFDPEHQWLASRGYAVLSVNYRGSTGFGKRFLNAGNMEWAGKMHEDLLDAVAYVINEKIAAPNKIAIMGGSYGGYATLVGLTFTPDTFACGVDIVGPSNLITLLETIPPYWAPSISLFTKRVGDHRTEQGRLFLTSKSPLTFADKIKKPLLIGQGANDPRVKQAEADQIVAAMRKNHIPVTYILYSDEGHGFARPENRLSFYAVTESFLGKCLSGKVEPIGDDFTNSTITAPEGEDNIFGLKEALNGH
jgi:dipeptidyl aminopeptidase/acylaminoacyl peptidase